MPRTELYIKPYGQSSYSRADLEDGIPMPFTYSILDISEPDKRQSNYSKTITLPGTANNHIIFNHIHKIGASSSFQTGKKADYYLIQNSIEVSRGVLQLLDIVNTTGEIKYEVALRSGLDDFFTKMGSLELSDLDLSSLNHSFTWDNIATSWSGTIGSGYVYPLINYTGHINGESDFRLTEMFPAVYVKEYLDRIFSLAGKSYTSAFFTSDLFKRLHIPFSGSIYQMTEAEIIAREFRAEIGTTQAITAPTETVVNLTNDSTGTAYDPTNQWNTSTKLGTIASTGYYDLDYNVEAWLSGSVSTNITLHGEAFIVMARLYVNAVQVDTQIIGAFLPTGFYLSGAPFTGEKVICGNTFQHVKLSASDTVQLKIQIINSSFMPAGITWQMNVGTNSYLRNIVNPGLTSGQTVDMDACAPAKVLQKDFIMSLVKCFHLYIEQDAANPNNYLIEPRDDWYNSTVIDWTNKLEAGQEIKLQPLPELSGNKYIFQYKEDKDYWNNQYQSRYQRNGKSRTYGDEAVYIDNDFQKDEIIAEPIFSPTILTALKRNCTLIMPAMYGFDGGAAKQVETNIRLLYWGGLKSFKGINYWRALDEAGNVVNTYLSTYPYAGNVDNPDDPTIDLSFGTPEEVQWQIDTVTYTDANLFNTYHKRFIDEITDNDSRLMTAKFILYPEDILTLSFRPLYFVNGELYRLHRILDYDFGEVKPVTVEFLRCKDPGAYAPTRAKARGGIDTQWPKAAQKDTGANFNTHANGITGSPAHITGVGNNIAQESKGIIVSGNNNTVGPSTFNINIMGNGNFIESGLSNITLIRTDNKVITASDQTYIDGVLYVAGGSSSLTDTHIFVGQGDNTAGDVALTLGVAPGVFALADTGVLTMPDASGGTRGLLNMGDWIAFNAKIGGTGTAGQVSYFSGSGTIGSDANFTYVASTGVMINKVDNGSGTYKKAIETFYSSQTSRGAIMTGELWGNGIGLFIYGDNVNLDSVTGLRYGTQIMGAMASGLPGYGIMLRTDSNLDASSGEFGTVHTYAQFSPTSGTATYNGIKLINTVNQTGGANGIVRGMYVLPTLTAVGSGGFRALNIDLGSSAQWGLYIEGSASKNYLQNALSIGGTSIYGSLNVLASAPTSQPNYGLVNFGGGPFDGATSGFFAGSASGTVLAINAVSGFTGKMFDVQRAGYSYFNVDYRGNFNIRTDSTTDLLFTGDQTNGSTGGSAGWVFKSNKGNVNCQFFADTSGSIFIQAGNYAFSANKPLVFSGYNSNQGSVVAFNFTSTLIGSGTSAQGIKVLDVVTPDNNFATIGNSVLTSGHYTGLHIGYRENSTSYRKTGILFGAINDGAARGNLHLVVNIGNDTNSMTLSDSRLMIDGLTGNIGIGVTSSPSAYLHLKAGAAAAGSAPLKFTSGTNLTTKEDGAFEYDGTHLYFTIGTTRNTLI